MTLQPDWMSLLRKVSIFSTFNESDLGAILKKMKPTALPKGAILVQKGTTAQCFYLILSGSIRIVSDALKNDGRTLAFLDRGDAIGEMNFLAGDPYSHTAIVETTAELLLLYKKDFDQLLEKNPTMAVMLSRVLSSQLSLAGNETIPPAPASKLISLFPALPIRDQVVFAVNLGLALVEQTRRKTLLVMVGPGHELLANSLGLKMPALQPFFAKEKFIGDRQTLDRLVMIHRSGLDVMSLDETSFNGPIAQSLFVFFQLIRDQYDYCLLFSPAKSTEVVNQLLKESDRSLVITGPQSLDEDLGAVRRLDQMMPSGKKLEKIWLSTNPLNLPREFIPDRRMAWDVELGKIFMHSGVPFIPSSFTMCQRMMDSLSRSLGSLTIGFAMGSGAAFGYALIGMLQVMERNGIYPDVISGTSMGALIGSFYAMGKTPDELESIAKSITRGRLLRMLDPTFPRSGLLHGRGVLNFLRSILGEQTFADLLFPFACVATDIQTGKEVVMNEGSVAEAVRASLSLPFFFEPYYKDGRYLVDGGLVNPVPTSTVITLGANVIISANLTSKTGERKMPQVGWRKQLPSMLRGPAIPEILLKTIYTMQYEIAQARSEISNVVMNVSAGDFLWWDLDKSADIIRVGEARAEESLPKIKSLLPFFSDSCKVHLDRRVRKRY